MLLPPDRLPPVRRFGALGVWLNELRDLLKISVLSVFSVVNLQSMAIKLKRFLLFAGENYYPRGGWEDFKGGFDTLEEARAEFSNLALEWNQVVDLDDLSVMTVDGNPLP